MTFVSYAQNLEDFMLWRALKGVAGGFYVDVGAHDPDSDSVSKAFFERGWRGVDIEPMPDYAARLRAARPGNLVVQAAIGATPARMTLLRFDPPGEGMSTVDRATAERLSGEFGIGFTPIEVPVRTLDDVLAEAQPAEIHWLKIDVEGSEKEVLSGLDLARWRPWVLVIEATEPNRTRQAHHAWDPIVRDAGYDFVFFDGLNRFYVARERAELAAAFEAPRNIFDDVTTARERTEAEERMRLTGRLSELEGQKPGWDDMRRALDELAAAREADRAARQALAEAQALEWERLRESLRDLGGSVTAVGDAQRAALCDLGRSVAAQSDALRISLADLGRAVQADRLRSSQPDAAVWFGSEVGRLNERSIPAQLAGIVQEVRRTRKRWSRSIRKRLPWQRERMMRRRLPAVAPPFAGTVPPAPAPLAAVSGGRTAAGFHLDAGRAMALGAWRRAAADLRAAAARDCRPDSRIATRPRRLLAIVEEGRDPAGIGRTLESLRVAAAGGLETGCAALFPDPPAPARAAIGLADALGQAEDDVLVWFARAGDTICAEIGQLAAGGRLSHAEMILGDAAVVAGDRAWPVLAPGVDYLHALNCDYFRGRFLARAEAVRVAVAAGAASAREVALHLLRKAYVARRRHAVVAAGLPLFELDEPPEAILAERKAVATAAAAVLPAEDGTPRLSTDIEASAVGTVSVVICTKDKGFLLRQLVPRLLEQGPLLADIVIVSNGTSNPHALRTLDEIGGLDRVRILDWDQDFNFSLQSNLGAEHSAGDLLLFLNDDVVPVSPRWLEELVAPFANPRTGITGPLLLYPDERVQHAGIFLGHGGVGGHHLRGARLPDEDFMFLASAPRFVSSVTGAVFMVRRELFERLNGFDPMLRRWIQDVDLCMRAGKVGYDVVYTPRSILLHMESVSVAETLQRPEVMDARWRELQHFTRRWGPRIMADPFHPALLSRDDASLRTLRLP